MSDIRGRRSPFLGLVVFAGLVFLYAPLMLVVLFSFHATPSLAFPFEGFSLHWYRVVLDNEQFRTAAINSSVVGLCVAGTTLVLGTAAAYAVVRARLRLRRALTLLLFLPISVPGLFLGLSLLIMFNRLHLSSSLLTVALAHWVYVLPYFMLIALQAFQSLDPALEELARDLGASTWRVFVKVTLPQIWPLLAGATVLAFVLSFDEFIITFFVIGPDPTLPLFVWSALRRSVDPSINVISTLMLAVSLGVTAISLALVLRRDSARRLVGESG